MNLLLSLLVAGSAIGSVPRPLVPGGSIRDSLAGGEAVVYSIEVPAGSAARVLVRQEGVDVDVTVRRRGSDLPTHGLDLVAGPTGDEIAYAPILDTPATWQVFVKATLPKADRGDYTIAFELLPGDDTTRTQVSAWLTHHHASDTSWVGDGPAHQQAQAEYRAAADAALAAGDVALAAEAIYQCAREHDSLGDVVGAIALQKRALELFERAGRPDREARVLNRLGDLSRKIAEVTDAERYFDRALPLARDAQDPVNIADIENNSGLLLLATGRPEEAIDRLQAAIPLAQEVDSANVELALVANVAEAYRSLGQYEKVVPLYQRGLVLAKRLSPRRMARTLYQLADTYHELGDTANAERTIRAALDEYTRAQDSSQEAVALVLWGQMLHERHDTDEAVAVLARAHDTLQRAHEPLGESHALSTWAHVELDRGETDSALAKAADAVRLARRAANPDAEQAALYVHALALRARGRIDDAVSSIASAVDSVEQARGALLRVDLRRSYLAAVRSYFDLYVDLEQQRGATAAAFAVSERARARTLLDGLAESAARIQKGVDRDLVARQRTVQTQLNAKEAYRTRLVAAEGDASPRAAAVGTEVDRLLDEWNGLRARIRASSPDYWSLEDAQTVALDTVQRTLLDADTVLISYYLGRTRSYVWVIDRSTITGHDLPAAAVIDALARRYHEALSQDVDALTVAERAALERDEAAIGAQLASIVWTPVAPRVRGRRVLVVADGALDYVPFAALPSASGAPLLTEHEIVNLPSASVLETIRRANRPRPSAIKAAVVADPVFSTGDPRLAAARNASAPSEMRATDGESYGRLRFSRQEADAIMAVAPGAFEALDFNASKQTLLARNLRQYSILHFATHGTLNTEHPELSGLVFSLVDRNGKPIDGFLRLHEIYNLDLAADLVVLSACRTALGKEVSGEGLVGLTRGFIYAGAARVVSSVWNVDDRASAQLMANFYSEMLTKHLTPAAALRAAQRSLLDSPRWANPHYWAAFGLQGDWR